ncbi:mycofactocin biosynthesis chaperone MftB [Haloechinothrix salitolerans]|uniref:Mycofactocin biosynthesis chaperone MftB n=1 Tax=Haloechinothrix salitolerans TaxID=926830 RepID=A0ABW2C403_9PSEU
MSTEAATGTARLDPASPYRLAPSVALRPEPFGALAYDFHSRRLSFLKTPTLVRVVRELADAPDVTHALTGAGVPPDEHPQYLHALAGLAEAGMIQPRETGS